MKTPYDIYKKEMEWKVITKAIKSLKKNKDIELLTPIDYIVGSICKELFEKKLSNL
jgi:hypothetical protein